MARSQIYPTRETTLSRAVKSIRKRLGVSQIRFMFLLSGRRKNANVSRWERGRRRPGIIPLLALLKLAETPEERVPIIKALESLGADERVERIRDILFSFSEPTALPLNHSIAPTAEGGNA